MMTDDNVKHVGVHKAQPQCTDAAFNQRPVGAIRRQAQCRLLHPTRWRAWDDVWTS